VNACLSAQRLWKEWAFAFHQGVVSGGSLVSLPHDDPQ
jgi:hypothetical protein